LWSEDEEKESKEELMDMLENAHICLEMKRKECKELHKRIKSLEQSFNELNATHERLIEAYEKLGKAHSKLEKEHSSLQKAHSSLLEQDKKEKFVVTCDVGLTCDIIDESFNEPVIIAPTNPSCSSSSTTTTTITSTTSDGFTCDASLMVENETLKREVDELIRALGNAYDGEACLLKCLGSQRFSLQKEGLGYIPKKGKVAFATPKASFVRGNGWFCIRCK
jgi:hypothetical protein